MLALSSGGDNKNGFVKYSCVIRVDDCGKKKRSSRLMYLLTCSRLTRSVYYKRSGGPGVRVEKYNTRIRGEERAQG